MWHFFIHSLSDLLCFTRHSKLSELQLWPIYIAAPHRGCTDKMFSEWTCLHVCLDACCDVATAFRKEDIIGVWLYYTQISMQKPAFWGFLFGTWLFNAVLTLVYNNNDFVFDNSSISFKAICTRETNDLLSYFVKT